MKIQPFPNDDISVFISYGARVEVSVEFLRQRWFGKTLFRVLRKEPKDRPGTLHVDYTVLVSTLGLDGVAE